MAESRRNEVALSDGVYVNSSQIGNRLTVVIGIKNGAECLLHWGLSQRPGGAWQRPSMACWPAHTVEAAGTAVRTPLTLKDKDAREIAIEFDLPAPASHLAFVLFFPRENRWLKSNGGDFMIRLPAGPDDVSSPQEALAAWVSGDDVVRQSFPLEGGTSLAAATRVSADQVRVHLACDADAPLLLHWGLAWQFRHEWQLPPESLRTKDTIVEQQAARTPFHERKELQYLELEFPRPADGAVPRWLKCVLFQPGKGAWLKCQGQEIYLPLFADAGADPSLPTAKLWDLAGQIVAVEKGAPSWTLMHRFNLCHDLLQNAQDDAEALALLYIWLRYSALRQLDWQRKYNTQPRELSHAQDRLTRRLAGIYRQASEDPARRNWIRLMFTTLGRGGEGQRVRDEILQIMHRNHLKETSGTFIEEWHQKLHNNTTPDDVVICAAYLEFLKSNGNVKQFYQSLETGGVTRDRLKGFERAIKTDPVFFADRKDVLIREFENFLRILKSVHAGTDLESSVAAARPFLNAGLKQKLDAILSRQQGSKDRMLTAIAAREELRGVLDRSNDAELRDLLFLDLALEEFVRGVVERQNLGQTGRDAVVDLVHAAMRNLKLSVDSPELAVCTAHWGKLCTRAREGQDWALHAKSVADRTARWVQEFSSAVYQSLQAKAEFMGKAFGAQAWTMNLFSEEVIRGGAAFALSLALRALDPLLRKAAGLGGWQVISPAHAAGRMRVVDRLSTVQSEQFAEDTVLVADAVEGNEEIPARVTAVITRDSPDLLSHVAVRARNAHVLFATCFESDAYARLKEARDRNVVMEATAAGDVTYAESTGPTKQSDEPVALAAAASIRPSRPSQAMPARLWVASQSQFTPEIVGGKSNNLNGLRGRLPDWIRLPASLALPFGVFEKVLADPCNEAVRPDYEALVAAADTDPSAALPRLRALLLNVQPPRELRTSLEESWRGAGLPMIAWERAWPAILRVWASKWNERAFLSRRAHAIPHDHLRMAVLIQQVVEAEYAYVIHTVNPLTGNTGEIYAEVVLGLGETLVGNYPGRALGFVCGKQDLQPHIVSYPGKNLGLYGRGVIFRSDSNGEDLEGFAGAGLYDSYLAEEPEHRLLDYRDEKLLWDANFRNGLMHAITHIALEVEKASGSPQDIEGAMAGGSYYVVQTRPQVGLDMAERAVA